MSNYKIIEKDLHRKLLQKKLNVAKIEVKIDVKNLSA